MTLVYRIPGRRNSGVRRNPVSVPGLRRMEKYVNGICPAIKKMPSPVKAGHSLSRILLVHALYYR